METISDQTVSIVLTSKGANAVRKGHPWLYESGVAKQNKEASSGYIAVLYDSKRKFAGVGLYDAHSPIVVRVLQSGKQTSLTKEWLRDRINSTIQKRKDLINSPETTGYRLVNGENDNIAGVVADIYDSTLVIKLDSSCWLSHLSLLSDIFIDIIKPERIILRLSRTVKEFSEIKDGTVIYGKAISAPITFIENGIRFYTDPVNGQKTGVFLDQRENRAEVGRLSRGRDVLNVFSYTGGFSLYAAEGGAKSVASLDLSRPALEECERNFQLNGFKTPHRLICGDAFTEMEKLRGAKYGVVIVDPPSFARKQADVTGALKAYEKLNRLAVNLVATNGTLVAASCSARVDKESFFGCVEKAVRASGRRYSITKKTEHASDHKAGFPEGAYLKCIYIRLD